MNFLELSEVAIRAARAAGAVIRVAANEPIEVQLKSGGSSYASQVLTATDKAAERVLLEHLLPVCQTHNLALLSEESEDDGRRFEYPYFWCIDPMDGTLAFVNRRPGYCVSVALLARNGTPHIGVVYDPTTDTVYHAVRHRGAYKNGQPWRPEPTNDHLTYVTDRTLAETPQRTIIEQILLEQVNKLGLSGIREIAGAGSVMNAIRVLENGPSCMLKLPKPERGGGAIWDFAATACIYHELNLPATDFAGRPLQLNRRDDVYMNHRGVRFNHW